jgi:pilus assembly protein CpaF
VSTRNHTSPLAPLEPWLSDRDVTDIMVDGYSRVFVRRRSRGSEFEEVSTPFQGNDHLMEVINSAVGSAGRKIDRCSPSVDMRLPDGSLLNVMIPPLSLVGPALTICKSLPRQLTAADLLRSGFWNEEIVEFIRACVQSRLNIVVSGGTASGKTTVLNIIAGMIPTEERIIAIERAGVELQFPRRREHVIRLHGTAPATEGKGPVTARHLVASALQMCPDRIVLSEGGDDEWPDLLRAMNACDGSFLASIHANGSRAVLTGLVDMAISADPTRPVSNVRRQVASAVDLITYQARMQDGHRKLLKVTEVLGLQDDTIQLQDIFQFRETSVEEGRVCGHFEATGHMPKFEHRVQASLTEPLMELLGSQ